MMKDLNCGTGNIELGIIFDARLKKPRISEQLLFTLEFYKKPIQNRASSPIASRWGRNLCLYYK